MRVGKCFRERKVWKHRPTKPRTIKLCTQPPILKTDRFRMPTVSHICQYRHETMAEKKKREWFQGYSYPPQKDRKVRPLQSSGQRHFWKTHFLCIHLGCIGVFFLIPPKGQLGSMVYYTHKKNGMEWYAMTMMFKKTYGLHYTMYIPYIYIYMCICIIYHIYIYICKLM